MANLPRGLHQQQQGKARAASPLRQKRFLLLILLASVSLIGLLSTASRPLAAASGVPKAKPRVLNEHAVAQPSQTQPAEAQPAQTGGSSLRFPKKVVISFADTKYAATMRRFITEAKAMDVFDEVKAFDETTIGQEYLDQHRAFSEGWGRKGWGYWLYKPYLIWKTLESLEEGDLLAYVDTGCSFNLAARGRLVEYFDIVSALPNGLLAFQLHDYYQGFGKTKEKCWTKHDTLQYLGCNLTWCYNQNQLVGGINFWKNTARNRQFALDWYSAGHADNYTYISDAPNKTMNHECWKDNRHDQSIFSVLCKLRLRKTGDVTILPDETWFLNNQWHSIEAQMSPIWARRLKY